MDNSIDQEKGKEYVVFAFKTSYKRRMRVQRQVLKRKLYAIIGMMIGLLLLTGIVFLGKRTQNENSRQEAQIRYSEEFYYQPVMESKVSHIPNKSMEYVKNELIMDVKFDADFSEVEKLIENYNGSIVGYIGVTNTYQIELQDNLRYDDLIALKEKLEKEDVIGGIYLNKIYPADCLEGFYPNDAEWEKEWSDTADGKNWALEFIGAPEAWNYMKNEAGHTPKEIKVGIFELGDIDYEHEDLRDQLIEPPFGNAEDKGDKKHGTAVSGIIGAGFDNAIGFAGVVPNVKLLAASWEGLSNHDKNRSDVRIDSMFYRAALAYFMSFDNPNYETTIINVSFGCSILAFAASRGKKEAIESLNELNEEIGGFLEILLNQGYDFLICKSAGNNNESFEKEKRYEYVRADAEDENAVCGYVEASSKAAEQYKTYDDYESRLDYGNVDAQYDIFSGITNSKIKDRILVVGSIGITEDNDFYASEYSCSGPRVDLLAPGENIYVLEPDDKYSDEGKWGTSYSAPYVSGTAGLMLSVNPELSGKELKELLMNSAAGEYSSVYRDRTATPQLSEEELKELTLNRTTEGFTNMFRVRTYRYQAVNADQAIRYADEYIHDERIGEQSISERF